jgi:hypothetical protein
MPRLGYDKPAKGSSSVAGSRQSRPSASQQESDWTRFPGGRHRPQRRDGLSETFGRSRMLPCRRSRVRPAMAGRPETRSTPG